uniref:Pathogen-related protein n=1 Tax=Fagus sylvatica TaxID=28930 RepID=A0A2N9EK34_FAGSY
MASPSAGQDNYRSYLSGEEVKNTKWRFGVPNYDVVNKLFEEGRTKIWPSGSLEEKVQNLLKTWEMEIFHKTSIDEFKSLDPKKYTFSLNDEETADSSHIELSPQHSHVVVAALEILQVYTGPPLIVFKFRHWGYMEGPFKGHAPTGEIIELYGMAIFELDEQMRVVKVEFFYDPGQLLGGLLKGASLDDSAEEQGLSCPVLRNTG